MRLGSRVVTPYQRPAASVFLKRQNASDTSGKPTKLELLFRTRFADIEKGGFAM
jgi:hypothetical protein